MRFYMETYGCSMNRSDSQIMVKLLEEAGFLGINDPRGADVIVLNTCNVKTPTEQRMIQRARELSRYAPLVVTGCMAKSQRDRLKNFSKVFVAPREIDKIVEAVISAIEGREAEFLGWRFVDKSSYLRDPLELIGIIPIAEGCMGACTYCITRLARGGLTSFPKRNILRLAEHFLMKGAVELWLTAEDTAAYGRDIGENLANLIVDLSDLPGDFRIRVGMMTPSSALPIISELIEAYRSRKVYKFFHLPVQSGSDRVLKDMGRNYTVNQFLMMIDFIRRELSDVSIATDIIVGFPTEDEEDFESTLAMLERLKPDVVNVSKFGARPVTKAAGMGKLPESIVSRRSKEVNGLIERIKEEVNERYLGKELEVLVSEKGGKGFQGRTNSYKPVALREVKLGHFYLVEIVDFKANYLIGEVKEELGRAGLQMELKLT